MQHQSYLEQIEFFVLVAFLYLGVPYFDRHTVIILVAIAVVYTVYHIPDIVSVCLLFQIHILIYHLVCKCNCLVS